MKLISCPDCGVVLNLERVAYEDALDYRNEVIEIYRCPVCGYEIEKDLER